MHSLYVAAHAVTVALVQHGRTRHDQAATTRRPLAAPASQTPYAVAPTTEWVRRMSAAEAAAASFAPPGRLHAQLNGEHPIPPEDAICPASDRHFTAPIWHVDGTRPVPISATGL